MDQNQTMEDMKFIGFPGIFHHSFKTIFTWKKIFAQITLTLLLPLAIIIIAHMTISHHSFNNFERNPFQLFTGAFDSYRSYYNTKATSVDWLNYFLFKFFTIVIVTALSTTSAVYTVASVYTGRDVTHRESSKVAPKVLDRHTATLLCMFLSLFAYSLIASTVIFIGNAVFEFTATSNLFSLVSEVVYIYGFLYLIVVWQLASVVSVLESSYGVKAMIKATDLMNGKRKTAMTTSFVLYLVLACVVFVVIGNAGATAVWRVMIGIVCGILVAIVFLVVVVTETVFYLVCKLYNGETVDLSSLSRVLSADLSDSQPVFRTVKMFNLEGLKINRFLAVNGELICFVG